VWRAPAPAALKVSGRLERAVRALFTGKAEAQEQTSDTKR
jgi:hypothetical protein